MRPTRLVLCVLVCLAACHTAPISRIHDLEVPAGLTSKQVEFVILASLADNPPPRELRAYPKTPAARSVIQAQARCSMAS
jgi:hypothetical protein